MSTGRIRDYKGYRIVSRASWSTEPYAGSYEILKARAEGEWQTVYHGYLLALFDSKRAALTAAEAAACAYIRGMPNGISAKKRAVSRGR
jgi:hypothetical protein